MFSLTASSMMFIVVLHLFLYQGSWDWCTPPAFGRHQHCLYYSQQASVRLSQTLLQMFWWFLKGSVVGIHQLSQLDIPMLVGLLGNGILQSLSETLIESMHWLGGDRQQWACDLSPCSISTPCSWHCWIQSLDQKWWHARDETYLNIEVTVPISSRRYRPGEIGPTKSMPIRYIANLVISFVLDEALDAPSWAFYSSFGRQDRIFTWKIKSVMLKLDPIMQVVGIRNYWTSI